MLMIEKEFFESGFEVNNTTSWRLDSLSFAKFLSNSWNDLTRVLDGEQLNKEAKARELSQRHARLLIAYWKNIADFIRSERQKDGKPTAEPLLLSRNKKIEYLSLDEINFEGPADGRKLLIRRKSDVEETEFELTEIGDQEVYRYDDYLHPIIKSKFKQDPEESENTLYEIDFNKNHYQPNSPFIISRFKRLVYHEELNHQHLALKDKRTISIPTDILP